MSLNVIVMTAGSGKTTLSRHDGIFDIDNALESGQTRLKEIRGRILAGEMTWEDHNNYARKVISKWLLNRDMSRSILLCHGIDYLPEPYRVLGFFKMTFQVMLRTSSERSKKDEEWGAATRQDWYESANCIEMSRKDISFCVHSCLLSLRGIVGVSTRTLHRLRRLSLAGAAVKPTPRTFSIGRKVTSDTADDFDPISIQVGKKREGIIRYTPRRSISKKFGSLSFNVILGYGDDADEDGIVVDSLNKNAVMEPSLFSCSPYGTLFQPKLRGVVPIDDKVADIFITTRIMAYVRPIDWALGVWRVGVLGEYGWLPEQSGPPGRTLKDLNSRARTSVVVFLTKINKVNQVVFDAGCLRDEKGNSAKFLYYGAISAGVGCMTKIRSPRAPLVVAERQSSLLRKTDPSGHIALACNLPIHLQMLYAMSVIANMRGHFDINTLYSFRGGDSSRWHAIDDYTEGLRLLSVSGTVETLPTARKKAIAAFTLFLQLLHEQSS